MSSRAAVEVGGEEVRADDAEASTTGRRRREEEGLDTL